MKEFFLNLWTGLRIIVRYFIGYLISRLKEGNEDARFIIYWLCYAVSFIGLLIWYINDPIPWYAITFFSFIASFVVGFVLMCVVFVGWFGWEWIKALHDLGHNKRMGKTEGDK